MATPIVTVSKHRSISTRDPVQPDNRLSNSVKNLSEQQRSPTVSRTVRVSYTIDELAFDVHQRQTKFWPIWRYIDLVPPRNPSRENSSVFRRIFLRTRLPYVFAESSVRRQNRAK